MLTDAEKQQVDNIWRKIDGKMKCVAERNADKIPYKTVNGFYDDIGSEHINWWTNGFWPGMMWLMYSATGEDIYRDVAQRATQKLEKALNNYDLLHHDVGFMYLLSTAAQYALTGCENSRVKTLLAADILAARYNPRGKYIRAWNEDEDVGHAVIIDTMMNLPLLFWSSNRHKDPRYKFIAIDHANTVKHTHIRPDGSVYHIVCLNPENGKIEKYLPGGGMSVDSAWARGIAWAIYGYTLCFIHTQNKEYIDIAKRSADYFVNSLGEDTSPKVDFKLPDGEAVYDSSAGACALCGIIEIAKHSSGSDKEKYIKSAMKLLCSLEKHCNWELSADAILGDCTVGYDTAPEQRNSNVIYGDYFFVEAIYKLKFDKMSFWY